MVTQFFYKKNGEFADKEMARSMYLYFCFERILLEEYRVSVAELYGRYMKIFKKSHLNTENECFMWLLVFICLWNYTFLGKVKIWNILDVLCIWTGKSNLLSFK